MSRYGIVDGNLVLDKDGPFMYVSDHNKLMAETTAKVQELATQLEWAKKGKEISQADLDAAREEYKVTKERWNTAFQMLELYSSINGYEDVVENDLRLLSTGVKAWLAEVKRKP